MKEQYFQRVTNQTSTRFWINNPTSKEMDLAIAAGAINVTTNPSYCSKLLKGEPEYIRRVIDDVIAETSNDDAAADLFAEAGDFVSDTPGA